jgi:hypothetical protein
MTVGKVDRERLMYVKREFCTLDLYAKTWAHLRSRCSTPLMPRRSSYPAPLTQINRASPTPYTLTFQFTEIPLRLPSGERAGARGGST